MDEPKGWWQLHAKAQQEKDPQRLALLIDQMNCILDQHEKMSTTETSSTRAPLDSDNFLKLDVHTWQYDA